MSYRYRLAFLIVLDSLIVATSIYVSNFILVDKARPFALPLIISSFTLLVSHHIFAYCFKLYKRAWEYASIGELVSIFRAISLSIFTTAFIQLIFFGGIYKRTLAITWMMHILLIGGSRFIWRMYRDTYLKPKSEQKRTLIIGAGSAGRMVARQLFNRNSELYPVAFVDDDVKKHNLELMGIPVIGDISCVKKAVEDLEIEYIVIAIPSLKPKELNKIYLECSKTKAKTQILPKIEDIMVGKVSINQFRDVQVEDLLGREPVELDMESISDSITNKTILVTGAGGSIGSEICRQVSKFSPEKLILLGHGENSIYNIEMELLEKYSKEIELITEIADVQDADKMMSIMNKHRPDVVYHAAAHKHVPLMERNPEEAVKNNVIGTKNVAEAADAYGVGTFVMVSTDKAVNPTSVMGATKRLAEMVVQHMNTISRTRFVAVRFGNVLGSRGSVIPLFKKQIAKGGPVTVTHPDMVRYFMTIPEASRLVLQAGALAEGGEIFVLDMGEPVKILDLAKNLIRLSGYSIEEIGIKFSGIRPGEKMFEEILSKNEVHDEQVYPKIYVGKTAQLYIDEVLDIIHHHDIDKDILKQKVLDLANNRVNANQAALIVN